MSKIILEFNIPEEREESDNALNGHKYLAALIEFAELLRKHRKYGILMPLTTEPLEAAQDMNDLLEEKFYEILRDRGVDKYV